MRKLVISLPSVYPTDTLPLLQFSHLLFCYFKAFSVVTDNLEFFFQFEDFSDNISSKNSSNMKGILLSLLVMHSVDNGVKKFLTLVVILPGSLSTVVSRERLQLVWKNF